MQQSERFNILCDTVDVFFEYIGEGISKPDMNIPILLEGLGASKVHILTQDKPQVEKIVYEQLKLSSDTFFVIDSLAILSPAWFITVSANPIEFNAKYFNWKSNMLVLFNSTDQNLERKQGIEKEFYKLVTTPALLSNNWHHISSLAQLIPYLGGGLGAPTQSKVIVGCHLYPKKFNDLLTQGIVVDTDRLAFVPIDLRYINAEQFALLGGVFHKNIDFNKGRAGIMNTQELAQIDENLKQITENNPRKIKIVDPMNKIHIIQSRVLFQEAFEKVIKETQLPHFSLNTPQIVAYTNGDDLSQNITFPLIIKTSSACSTKYSHTMGLVVSRKGLENALKEECFKNNPLIFQQLVQHDGVIYKIYVIGNSVTVQARPSLPNIELANFIPQEEFCIFDSQQNLIKQLTTVLRSCEAPNTQVNAELMKQINEFASILSPRLSADFNFSVYGYDLLLERNSNKMYIIDINYFPGFKHVDNVVEQFRAVFAN